MEDCRLIDLYWNRKEIAILETNKKYGRYCTTIASNILRNIQDSEECVNDTYLNVWNAIPSDRPTVLKAYIGKITRNLAINKYNEKMTKKRGSGEIALIYNELENCIPCTNTLDNKIESYTITKVLNEFLLSLDEEKRIIFVRRYWYADSIRSISKRFSYSESKIKSILFRARKNLKEHLKKEGIYL